MNTQSKVNPYIFPLLDTRVRQSINKKSAYGDYLVSKTLSLYGYTSGQVEGKSRLQDIVECRHVICKILRMKTNMSLVDIAKKVGNRNHATIIHSIKTIDDRLLTDKKFKRKYEEILDKL